MCSTRRYWMSEELEEKIKALCVDILRDMANKMNAGKIPYNEASAELRKRADWIDNLNEFGVEEDGGREGEQAGSDQGS